MFREKLIRDHIPRKVKKKTGEVLHTRIASKRELRHFLRQKLLEEVAEYLETPCPEELVDILEIVRGLGHIHKLSPTKLERVRKKKVAESGGFKKRTILILPKTVPHL
jgi:predicted house-cleaning noncanonical NTP pyrophosphatase (MazG superfamily)